MAANKGKAAGSAIGAMPQMSAEDKKRAEQWQAEDDLRTLVRANEIRKDPRRLARARAMAQEQIKAAQTAATAIK